MPLELRIDDIVLAKGGQSEEGEPQVCSRDARRLANRRDAVLERADRAVDADLQVIGGPLDMAPDHRAGLVDADDSVLVPPPSTPRKTRAALIRSRRGCERSERRGYDTGLVGGVGGQAAIKRSVVGEQLCRNDVGEQQVAVFRMLDTTDGDRLADLALGRDGNHPRRQSRRRAVPRSCRGRRHGLADRWKRRRG